MENKRAQLKHFRPSNNLKDSVFLSCLIWQLNWDFKTPKIGLIKAFLRLNKNAWTKT